MVLILAGVATVAWPLAGELQRSRQAQQALDEWRSGGSAAIAGAVPGDLTPGGEGTPGSGASPGPAACRPGANRGQLVTFKSLARYGYAAVAVDGTWDTLRSRFMVHYAGSAEAGAAGNDVIAFHREPRFQRIDELGSGDVVEVQDGSCRTWVYRVTDGVDVLPEAVDQLGPTSGHDLTLVTCTPWYQDTRRLVWRATLVG